MSKINDGGSAFPCTRAESWASGMTLRDYFAAKAMQGMLARSNLDGPDIVARAAYATADAMLAQREK